LVTIFAVAEAGRIRRDTDQCEKINVAHKECVKTAYDDYVAAHGAGDDGRGDWEARKSCNYVNAAVGDCGDLLSGCYGEEGTTAQKDHQVETILKQLERTVGGWDSSKCPVVREYLERQAGNTDDEEEEETGDGDQDQGAEEGAEDAEEEAADDGEPSEDAADEDDGEAEDDDGEGDGEEGDEEAVEDDAGQGDEDEEADDDEADDNEDEEEEENEDDENSSTALFSSFAMMMACLTVIA